ncbi:MAG: DNA-binding response regulator [Chloroflexi bacterium]|nr:MAG: DNA-binding response regulator [Chloroflexota bacterium]
MGNSEIAQTLFLSEGTIKNYVSVVFSKLGVTDRTQAPSSRYARGWSIHTKASLRSSSRNTGQYPGGGSSKPDAGWQNSSHFLFSGRYHLGHCEAGSIDV